MVNSERLINSFIAMVQIESMSRNEKNFMKYLQSEFVKRGFIGSLDKAGDKTGSNCGNLLLRRESASGSEPVLFSAHMDTVVNGANIKVVRDADRIRSDGTTILGSDDKAGIATLLEAIDVCLENRYELPVLEVLFTVCEEQGLMGAKNFDYSQLRSRMGFVLDAGDAPGSVVVQSPCQNFIGYTVYGKSAHAGMHPEKGVNAIHVMAGALARMECGRIDEETTCNFGTIEGGQARNIVPDICKVGGESRSLKREKMDALTERLTASFLKTVDDLGAEGEVKVEFLYPEICLAENEPVVQVAVEAARKAGIQPSLVKTGGGSDASIINGAGIRCANLGIGMQNVHTVEEYILVEDLVADAGWIAQIMRLCSER